MYVRLFGRLFKWINESKIKYPKIAKDLSPTLVELVKSGLLHDGILVVMIIVTIFLSSIFGNRNMLVKYLVKGSNIYLFSLSY